MKKRIMLVDDSVTIHRVIDLCLDKEKYDVVKVFSKEESLSHIKTEKPDLILLDNKLGDITSKDMIAALRGAAGNVVIILLTGAFDQFDSNLCHIVGADDFIYKPFDAKTLEEKIASGFRGAPRHETLDISETPTDEELAAAMTDVPEEMEMMLTEEEPKEEELPVAVEDITLPEELAEEKTVHTEPEIHEEPVFEEPVFDEPVQVHPVTNVEMPSVAEDALSDIARSAAPSSSAFDGLIEVDEDQILAEEELRKEEERLAAELAMATPEPEEIIKDEPEQSESEPHDSFEGLVEVDENPPEEKEAEQEEPVEVVLEQDNELTDDEQENLFIELEEQEGDELDNILDGINEEHISEDVTHADATLNDAEEALDETVETVLTDIQAELSLSDVMEEQVEAPIGSDDAPADIPADEEPADEPEPFMPAEPKDIDPEPLLRISEEKLVEAVYEAIDEDTLKFAIKEVLTDKITRILEEELPVLVERAIRKEIERLVKGK
ncbi:MAG: response regulator [Deferribacterales bacterium]